MMDKLPTKVVDLEEILGMSLTDNGFQIYTREHFLNFKTSSALAKTWIDQIQLVASNIRIVEPLAAMLGTKEVYVIIMNGGTHHYDLDTMKAISTKSSSWKGIEPQIVFQEPEMETKFQKLLKKEWLEQWKPRFSEQTSPKIQVVEDEQISKAGAKVLYRIAVESIFPTSLDTIIDQSSSWVLDMGMVIYLDTIIDQSSSWVLDIE
jgi:hypothetical protein